MRENRKGKKAFVRLVTNLGNINMALHCDLVRRRRWCRVVGQAYLTCAAGTPHVSQLPGAGEEGLLQERAVPPPHPGLHGKAAGSVPRRTGGQGTRCAERVMQIQGGDPTGTGRGGKPAFDGPLIDVGPARPWPPTARPELRVALQEIDKELSHSDRGVVSMANHGPNTGGSQLSVGQRSAAVERTLTQRGALQLHHARPVQLAGRQARHFRPSGRRVRAHRKRTWTLRALQRLDLTTCVQTRGSDGDGARADAQERKPRKPAQGSVPVAVAPDPPRLYPPAHMSERAPCRMISAFSTYRCSRTRSTNRSRPRTRCSSLGPATRPHCLPHCALAARLTHA
jgi:hypothetical protein